MNNPKFTQNQIRRFDISLAPLYKRKAHLLAQIKKTTVMLEPILRQIEAIEQAKALFVEDVAPVTSETETNVQNETMEVVNEEVADNSIESEEIPNSPSPIQHSDGITGITGGPESTDIKVVEDTPEIVSNTEEILDSDVEYTKSEPTPSWE